MHPEVRSDTPGYCPKCGMALVQVDAPQKPAPKEKDNYAPLIVVVLLILAVAAAVTWRWSSGAEGFVLAVMTGFFLVFGGFKLMDLPGFAEGYSTYDLLAQRARAYGFVYPFLELAFGLSMVAGYHPDWLLWTEFGVMAFSGIGVAIKVAKKERFRCACLGTFLKVPLTYVTLIEDFGMAILALLLLFAL